MKRTQAIELPQEEIAKQKEWMAEFAALEDRPRTYCVVTYGCQMNAHDSETLEGMLAEMGMTPASTREEADFVIFNTCCVRDNAQRRALGNVVWLKELKKTRPELMVGVCGCMMQQPGMGEQILKQYPFVDLAFGTHNLYRFAQLLAELDKVGIERIRFMTSHPKDISDELIDVMAASKHICHALHLPVQHGSNRILQSMNRRYTREKYLERVEAIRAKVPDISLTTDLIVGYPGETEEEFEETCSLVERVGYDSAFTFIYSPRVGTRAADMPDQIPESVSSRRIQKLIALQKEITHKRYAKYIGQEHNVLVEEASRRDENQMAGKNEYNITVNFPGDKSLVGQIVKVKITSAGESTLRGERVD